MDLVIIITQFSLYSQALVIDKEGNTVKQFSVMTNLNNVDLNEIVKENSISTIYISGIGKPFFEKIKEKYPNIEFKLGNIKSVLNNNIS